MAKKIVSIGMLIASDVVDHVEFTSKASLLDWDIILFRPNVSEFTAYDYGMSNHSGKLCLNDQKSFALKEACEHWRREIKEAVEIGKTVIVHLCKPEEVFVQTGNKEYSGTGRNQKTINLVEPFTSYRSLPIRAKWTTSQGREMLVHPDRREILATYWDKFGPSSTYQVTFTEADKSACLTTRHGRKAVGLHIASEAGKGGNLVLLPDMEFNADEFFAESQDDDDYEPFTEAARQFAATYVAEIVALDRALLQGAERTAEPEWARAQSYSLAAEVNLREELLRAEEAVERAQHEKEALKTKLLDESKLRGLLFETGKPLEAVLLKALRILGFDAENFEDDKNEFDAVFSSAEGRLLGEAEGKDNKAINITKLRQLTMNIDEDFERDEVEVRAKGVLFGNAYRLTPPDTREAPFTDKCISSAVAQSIALVHTPDLFTVTRHVVESGDQDFAKHCREAMLRGVGVVSFPAVPEVSNGGKRVEVAVGR